jgi:hypothetical protein
MNTISKNICIIYKWNWKFNFMNLTNLYFAGLIGVEENAMHFSEPKKSEIFWRLSNS